MVSPTSRSDLFHAGQTFGKFYLLELIGQGGTAKVFKAIQQPINRVVALKIPDFSECEEILTPDEFLSEAMAMARLEHSNIVRIYDFGIIDEKAFLCMEYVEGPDVVGLMQNGISLPESVVLSILLQIFPALQYAHQQGVLHRDLSPRNILISPHGLVKLTDFGMSGKKGQALEKGRIVGTPSFLSPEHIKKAPCTPGSDLFSFASIVYFLSTGRLLFDPDETGNRLDQLFFQIEQARTNPPEQKLINLPPFLASICYHALRSDSPEIIERELNRYWREKEANNDPSAVIRQHIQSDKLFTYQELRRKYFQLRDSGSHKEAVELLESALAGDPGNLQLLDLLVQPWKKPKTGLQTIGLDDSQPNIRPKKRILRMSLLVLIPMVMLMLLAWIGTYSPAGEMLSGMAWNEYLQLSLPKLPPATTQNSVPPAVLEPEKDMNPIIPENFDSNLQKSSVETPERAKSQPTPAPRTPRRVASKAWPKNAPSGTARTVERQTPASALPSAPATSSPGPGLALDEPPGVQVALNDTIRFTSPSPGGGWRISPGVVNFVLSHPDFKRDISSTLFLHPDTLYTLMLNTEGGYLVKRMKM